MAPLYDFECPECENEFEHFLKLENYKANVRCPKCKHRSNKVIRPKRTEPSFTEKLYPYFDRALRKRFDSPSERKAYLIKHDLRENPSKERDSRESERRMYDMRIGNFDPRRFKYVND
jgi:putative FmdB family regulatory protein